MENGNIEYLHPLYVEPGTVFESAAAMLYREKVYRIDVQGLRHYVRESGRTYKSLTTFLSAVMPKNKPLETWREKMTLDLGSTEKMDEWMEIVADYGTALHIAVADYCRNGGVDWSELQDWAYNYLIGAGLKADTLNAAANSLVKDVACLLQFFHEYQVRVIAVELPVFLQSGVATLIDLVVEMNVYNYEATEEGKRKRVIAIINLKSGKKGFFKEHALQLTGERLMFNETFGDVLKVEEVYNLAPTEWEERPAFKLKRWTKDIEKKGYERLFENYIEQAKIENLLSEPQKTFPTFEGWTKYGDSPTAALTIMPYSEFARNRIEQYTQKD